MCVPITTFLQGTINENKGNPVTSEISVSVLLGADAIASCVLSQNENLKLPEDLVEGRVGLPFEFFGILGWS